MIARSTVGSGSSRISVVLPVIVLLAVPVGAQDAAAPNAVPSIVTTGEAIVRRAADQAIISASVETRARNPRDAQRQNAELMATVQKRLADAGISSDAVRTTGYSVQQEYDYSNGRRIPREYVAHNGVEVRLGAIERTGELLDLLVQAGATNVAGVRFDLKDRAAAEREALRLAVVDARGRADALAAGAGRSVDRILRIDDTRPQPIVMPMRQELAVAKTADAATPIEPGMIEIHARVVLTVAIK